MGQIKDMSVNVTVCNVSVVRIHVGLLYINCNFNRINYTTKPNIKASKIPTFMSLQVQKYIFWSHEQFLEKES